MAQTQKKLCRDHGLDGGPIHYGPFRIIHIGPTKWLFRCPSTETWACWCDVEAIRAHGNKIAFDACGGWTDPDTFYPLAETEPIAYRAEDTSETMTLAEALELAEEVG